MTSHSNTQLERWVQAVPGNWSEIAGFGAKRTYIYTVKLGYNEHFLSQIGHFCAQIDPVIANKSGHFLNYGLPISTCLSKSANWVEQCFEKINQL